MLWVEFERYIFCCTHLSLTPEDRMLSLPILRREAAFAHKPLFIAGDWNATAHSPFITEISKDFQLLSNPKQATFPASTPDSLFGLYSGLCKEWTALYPFVRMGSRRGGGIGSSPGRNGGSPEGQAGRDLLCGALSPKSYGGRHNGDVADPCPYV